MLTKSRYVLLFTVAVLAARCGGNSPAAPSGNSAAGSTAVIAGVVSGTGGASGLNASASGFTTAASPMAGMTVRVTGTDKSAVVGSGGEFQLPDVPAGKVELQFKSESVNASTTLPNVGANQYIQIQVQVTATTAVVVGDTREGKVTLCHAEGNGTYHSISISESAESSHRAHGDGKVDDAVPGQALKYFDESCKPVGPSIDIEKYTNGDDADSAPGPSIVVGRTVTWRYDVKNTGTVNLTSVAVTDDKGVVVSCAATSLAAGASMTCTGTGMAALGQYTNLGTVRANYSWTKGSGSVSDADRSHYLGISATEEDGPKVKLCHKTGNNGRYQEVEVSVSAEPAHRAHGDGKIGEAVPDLPGKVFLTGCAV